VYLNICLCLHFDQWVKAVGESDGNLSVLDQVEKKDEEDSSLLDQYHQPTTQHQDPVAASNDKRPLAFQACGRVDTWQNFAQASSDRHTTPHNPFAPISEKKPSPFHRPLPPLPASQVPPADQQ
jgi:hypothetical protein